MRLFLLYSGGKDSSLAAHLLKILGFDVVLCTVNFGVLPSFKPAQRAAKALGFEHVVLNLNRDILEKACELVVSRGYPRDGIKYIHLKALEAVAEKAPAIADGIRRDDLVPKLSLQEIRSLEDRFQVEYISPLLGLGYKTINRLSEEIFEYDKDLSENLEKSDYEAELRELLNRQGYAPEEFFPKEHYQTVVRGYKR